MRALAEGAEVPFEDIIAINARTELLHGSFGKAREGPDDVDGCTGAVALPPTTREGHLIHAQNWDWRDECAESSIVLKIVPDVGPSMLVFAEAGVMASVGLNNAGIAISTQPPRVRAGRQARGLAQSLVRRHVLAQCSLGSAIEAVLKAERGFSSNFLISHREGEAIDLETTPDQVFWLTPEDDLLVHANHFVSPPAEWRCATSAFSRARTPFIGTAACAATCSEIAAESRCRRFRPRFRIASALRARVCRAPIPGKSSSTVATIIMDTTSQIMWVAPRPYGPHKFTEYRLP